MSERIKGFTPVEGGPDYPGQYIETGEPGLLEQAWDTFTRRWGWAAATVVPGAFLTACANAPVAPPTEEVREVPSASPSPRATERPMGGAGPGREAPVFPPTEESPPTATAAAAATERAKGEPGVLEALSEGWTQVFSDDFSSETGWDTPKSGLERRGGQLIVGGLDWVRAYNDVKLEMLGDFRVEAIITPTQLPRNGAVGVLFGTPGRKVWNDSPFYQVTMESWGVNALGMDPETGEWAVEEPTPTEVVKKGEATLLQIDREGKRIKVYVNGTLVTSMEDVLFEGSEMPLQVGVVASKDAEATFDQIRISVPEEALPAATADLPTQPPVARATPGATSEATPPGTTPAPTEARPTQPPETGEVVLPPGNFPEELGNLASDNIAIHNRGTQFGVVSADFARLSELAKKYNSKVEILMYDLWDYPYRGQHGPQRAHVDWDFNSPEVNVYYIKTVQAGERHVQIHLAPAEGLWQNLEKYFNLWGTLAWELTTSTGEYIQEGQNVSAHFPNDDIREFDNSVNVRFTR